MSNEHDDLGDFPERRGTLAERAAAPAPGRPALTKPPEVPPKAPTVYRVTFRIRKGGIPIDLEREAIPSGDLLGYLNTTLANLTAAGFEGAEAGVNVQVSAPTSGSAAGGEGVLTVNPDGTRSCTIHGPGRYSPPAPNPRGGTYPGRWWCAERECKAKEPKPVSPPP